MSSASSCPIIGIGASAGGLEAIKAMFGTASTPCGLAFVLVQHLDPNHESMMAEIIGRNTALKVRQISGGERVEAENVYVIPPGFQLSIEDGVLRLSSFEEPRGLRRPIDEFFDSLAADQGADAACVILSGTGADGSTGLRAIKEYGGIVVAQQPQTAAYDGMPTAAISTGLVDFSLKPENICEKLAGYFERRSRSDTDDTANALVEYLEDLYAALNRATGHDFTDYKRPTMLRRIQRRMQVLAIVNPAEYVRRVQSDESECQALLQDLLINVTSFFRDPDMFRQLNEHVILPLVEKSQVGTPIRVWVPGCSSGEEAYTIAMLFAAAGERTGNRPNMQIFATDIDAQMLNVAREARYPLTSLKEIPDHLQEQYLIGLDGRFQISPRIRDMVQFSSHSVIKDPPFSKLDLVSCRNMLIYMGEKIQKTFIPLMHYALKQDGVLFLGPSEGIGNAEKLFEPIDQKARIFRRREGRAVYPLGFSDARHIPNSRPTIQTDGKPLPRPGRLEVSEATKRILERYAHASVVVDELGHILASNGKLSKFLEFPTDQSAMHAVTLARPGLAEAMGPLLRRAATENKRVAAKDVEVRAELGIQTIDIAVDPLPDNTLLVVFVEVGTFRAETASDLVDDIGTDDRFHDLEEELRQTRFRLRSAVEELETANEELKSSNEEMMSMNEELQSANEELSTLNEELKNKVDLLSMANDDMTNFVDSTEIALVVVDRALRVRSFTHPIVDIFPLKETDTGRQLSEMASLVTDAGIANDARSVITGASPVQRLVASKDGEKTYSMRVLPYRSDNQIEGATLTFVDVSQLKEMETALRSQTDKLQLALEAGEMGVWDFDVKTETTTVDDVMRQVWELGPQEDFTVESFMQKIVDEDRQAVQEAIDATISGGSPFKAVFRVEQTTGTRWLQGAGRLREGKNGDDHMTGVNFDITAERKALEARDFLIKEINHRVKNLFAIVPALLSLAAREAGSIEDLVKNVRDRIAALGRAHEISQGNSEVHQSDPVSHAADLQALVTTVLEPYRGDEAIAVASAPVAIPADSITPLGLILHEWATNSAKYGALSEPDGRVAVDWTAEKDRVILTWEETGGPEIEDGTTMPEGFGSRLVTYSVAQLGGTMKRDWNGDGLTIRIEFSLPTRRAR